MLREGGARTLAKELTSECTLQSQAPRNGCRNCIFGGQRPVVLTVEVTCSCCKWSTVDMVCTSAACCMTRIALPTAATWQSLPDSNGNSLWYDRPRPGLEPGVAELRSGGTCCWLKSHESSLCCIVPALVVGTAHPEGAFNAGRIEHLRELAAWHWHHACTSDAQRVGTEQDHESAARA